MAIGDFFRINTNIAAYNALYALKSLTRNLGKVQLKLATGLRINEVADDPAGFTISTRLQARSRGLTAALDNVGFAKNALSTAEGGLNTISDIVLNIKEKVTQAASDTLGSAERNAIKKEINQLTAEIDDVVEETTFNNQPLLNGTYSNISVQTGERPGEKLRIDIRQNLKAASLNLSSTNVSKKVFSSSNAASALEKVNSALETVLENQQKVGALNSRLSIKERNLGTSIINTESTISRIRDVDLARVQLESIRLYILRNTATSMLAQANLIPYSVFRLYQ